MAQPNPESRLVGRTLGAYRIIESLGSGGMGEVYLAHDTRLDRRVALKVLPPETASHPEKIARFEREARAVASLSHPGIVTLHSIEEADGLRFLTMEHVEGETLSKQIPARGFPMERLLPLGIALTDAVAAAHRQGILHRDLKPENIMLDADGRLKVLDFGLAKLRDEAVEEGDRTTRETRSVTLDGRIVGTVAYMSPEQAEGLAVDHRSDIFAVGILLYEMATGERPFRGKTNVAVLSSILKDNPRPVSELRNDIPKPLARMIERALAKRPEDRYQSSADLRRDLEDLKRDFDSGELLLRTTAGRPRVVGSGRRRGWLMPVALVGVVVLVGLVGLVVRSRGPAVAKDGRQSIAVFYFDNLSGDPKLDWLRTGLTDMLVTNLSQTPGLRVLGTSRLYQILDELGHRDDRATSARVVASVAAKAQATTALVGSFVRAGPQLRISASLQDPRSGEVLVSERVEGRAEDDLFALVDELTGRLRKRLETPAMARHAERQEKKLAEVTTTSVEAFKAYAEGSRLHERLQEREAQAHFERAIEADPGFAMALAKLSVVHGNLGNQEKARSYSALAVAKAGSLPPGERFYIEGRHHSLDPASLDSAVDAYRKALDAAPDHTAARNNLAQLLIELRRYPEALVHLEDLRQRGMSFPGTYMSLAQAYLSTGHPEKARGSLSAYIAEHPDRSAGYENIAYFELAQGQISAALAAFDKAAALHPDDSMKIETGRFMAHALLDQWAEAETAAKRLFASDDARARWEGGASLALTSLYRGNLTEARRLLDEGAKAGRTPEERVGARLFRAQIEVDLGRHTQALAEVEYALAETGSERKLLVEGHAVRAVCLTRLGRGQEAEKSKAEVLSFLTTLPHSIADPVRLQLEGELALARGDRVQARVSLQKAVELAPPADLKTDSAAVEVHYALARSALAEGDLGAARKALVNVIEAGPARVKTPIAYVRSLALLAAIEEKAGGIAEARRLYERYLGHWKHGQIDRAEVARATERLATLRSRPAA
ncbi:MAG TPA: protein kinase [Vicinamibacteria bacterium]|nr:protein kinase [Vicinamibacteria bacterium]